MLLLGLGLVAPASKSAVLPETVTIVTNTCLPDVPEDVCAAGDIIPDFIRSIPENWDGKNADAEDFPRNADGTTAIPWWYLGAQFKGRTICIESNLYLAPLNTIMADWKNLNPAAAGGYLLNPTPDTRVGGCAARTYALSQRVTFTGVNVSASNFCARTLRTVYTATGYIASARVEINYAADKVACRGSGNWTTMWNHEFGHTVGLAHTPTTETDSVMHAYNDLVLHPGQLTEKPRIANIYTNNPLFG